VRALARRAELARVRARLRLWAAVTTRAAVRNLSGGGTFLAVTVVVRTSDPYVSRPP